MASAPNPLYNGLSTWMRELVHALILTGNGAERCATGTGTSECTLVHARVAIPIQTETTSKWADSQPASLLSALICVLEHLGPFVAFLLFLFCSSTTYNLNWWFWRVLCKNSCSANILSLVLRHFFKILCCLLHSPF